MWALLAVMSWPTGNWQVATVSRGLAPVAEGGVFQS
jgi:hypothetical protein